MKSFFKALLILMISAIMITPVGIFAIDDIDSAENESGKGSIEILFSHDMHSHLEKFPKIETVIRETTELNPNTFVFDAGDFSMGTPFQTIYKSQASELRMMGYVGYDAVTLGNHEFDYRSAGLTTMLNTALKSGEKLPKMVISNIDWKKTLTDKDKKTNGEKLRSALEKYDASDYTIIEKEGARIAVFGIFGNESASYAPESGTCFSDPVETARKTVEYIKKNEKADLIVCLSHSGTNDTDKTKSEDEILAKEVTGIDLIISGHSHTELDEPIIVKHEDKSETLIASCGQYNSNLGSVEYTFKEGHYSLEKYNLIPLNDTIEDDADTQYVVDAFKENVDDEYFGLYGYSWDDVLAKNGISFTDIDEFGLTAGEDTLGNLISDSYIYGVKQAEGDKYEHVTLAVAPAGVIRGSFKTGDVTTADAFNALSLGTGKDGKAGYPIVSIYLNGEELRTVAEVDATVSDMMQPARLYMSGLKYTYNPHRLMLDRAYNVKVTDEKGNETEPEKDKLYRVVGDLYSCQMLGTVNSQSYGLLSVTPKDKDGNEITDFEKHIVYNRDGSELKEWYALASYIDDFKGDRFPSAYESVEGRRLVEDSRNIWDLIKDPNRLFIIFVCLIILVIGILILIVVLIVKLVRRIKYGKGYKRHYKKKKKETLIFSKKRRW